MSALSISKVGSDPSVGMRDLDRHHPVSRNPNNATPLIARYQLLSFYRRQLRPSLGKASISVCGKSTESFTTKLKGWLKAHDFCFCFRCYREKSLLHILLDDWRYTRQPPNYPYVVRNPSDLY